MEVQVNSCAGWATAGWLQYLTSLDVNTSHPISKKKNLSRLWHQSAFSTIPKPKINIHLRRLFRPSTNSPTGTFRSMHSSICLMWLGRHYFCVLHSNLLTIPLRGGGGGGAVKSRQQPEQPPGGLKTASKWGDGLCRGGISQGTRLQSHVRDGMSDSKKCCWHIFSPCKCRIFWDH